jgi:hypothetical protein
VIECGQGRNPSPTDTMATVKRGGARNPV